MIIEAVRPGVARVVRAFQVTLVVAFLGYAVSTVPGVRPEPGLVPWLDVWVNNLVEALAALVCGLRVVLVHTGRLPWAIATVGLVAYLLGDLLLLVSSEALVVETFPSPSDVLWLTFYLALLITLVLLLREQALPRRHGLWVDGVVSGLAAAAAAVALFEGLVTVFGGSPSALGTNLVYLAADLVMIVVVAVAVTVLGRAGTGVWSLIGGAVLLATVADVAYLPLAAQGEYVAGGLVGSAWIAPHVALALAAWHSVGDARSSDRYAWAGLVAPALFTVVAVAVLVVGATVRLSPLAVILATLALLAGAARAGLAFRVALDLGRSREQARTDELTGLPNRRALYEQLSVADTTTEPFAVLVVDLDGFKEVNESLGHGVGDELLREVGARLRRLERPGRLVSRVGGDEFTILLTHRDQAVEATAVAHEALTLLRRPFRVASTELHIGASIGVAVGGLETTGELLLQQADTAMYCAKREHSGVHAFRAGEDDTSWDRLITIAALRSGIGAGELVIHVQPQIDIRTRRCVAVEVLVRWERPGRGLVFPDDFIPLAQQSGLLWEVTEEVMRLSLNLARELADRGREIPVAVNISASDIGGGRLPDLVLGGLAARGLPPQALVLEVTEQVIVGDLAQTRRVLDGLRAAGVSIAIDDYGTGYSALAYLQELRVDQLKLDRTFLHRVPGAFRSEAIVESSLKLATHLGLQTVAEGVEDVDQLAWLDRHGCDLAQGYHVARPMPASQLAGWLSQHEHELESHGAAERSGRGQT